MEAFRVLPVNDTSALVGVLCGKKWGYPIGMDTTI